MEQCYQLFHADFESVSEMLQEVTATNSWQNYLMGADAKSRDHSSIWKKAWPSYLHQTWTVTFSSPEEGAMVHSEPLVPPGMVLITPRTQTGLRALRNNAAAPKLSCLHYVAIWMQTELNTHY